MDCAYKLLELKREEIFERIKSLPLGHPSVGRLVEYFNRINDQILNYNHNKTMNKDLTIVEQLMENHNNGLFTIVKDSDSDASYTVYSTLDANGRLRMGAWCDSEIEALQEIGDDYGDDDYDINYDEITIVRTFNPSDYMKECGQKNKEIKAAIETLKKAGMLVDGKVLNLS